MSWYGCLSLLVAIVAVEAIIDGRIARKLDPAPSWSREWTFRLFADAVWWVLVAGSLHLVARATA